MNQPQSNSDQILNLADLQKGLPAITPAFGAALAEACAVCLTEQAHKQGIELQVEGDLADTFQLFWPTVTDQMKRCWNDEEYATEQAAYGVTLMVIQRLTDFTVVERARRGTGFDYWLGTSAESTETPFRKSVRLEVSGIRRGSQRQIRSRVKLKLEQVKPTDDLAPAYIAVIEFSQPSAWVVKR
ncbi:hypothetical protein N836_21295 [Leptolyngbya sp. Heron Island J]|uniref:hypothetical protein n=1 Tax=Leptolyngbya sp. Heron Island J TaxID=1385935 RepID=UPI0003B94337|nr:hypothetical protein [Leptolyngbya sp. Heron Island J]ESA33435.1 hypothetical protein N836_21295 [Leptolyngbya sp. Heron Island J]